MTQLLFQNQQFYTEVGNLLVPVLDTRYTLTSKEHAELRQALRAQIFTHLKTWAQIQPYYKKRLLHLGREELEEILGDKEKLGIVQLLNTPEELTSFYRTSAELQSIVHTGATRRGISYIEHIESNINTQANTAEEIAAWLNILQQPLKFIRKIVRIEHSPEYIRSKTDLEKILRAIPDNENKFEAARIFITGYISQLVTQNNPGKMNAGLGYIKALDIELNPERAWNIRVLGQPKKEDIDVLILFEMLIKEHKPKEDIQAFFYKQVKCQNFSELLSKYALHLPILIRDTSDFKVFITWCKHTFNGNDFETRTIKAFLAADYQNINVLKARFNIVMDAVGDSFKKRRFYAGLYCDKDDTCPQKKLIHEWINIESQAKKISSGSDNDVNVQLFKQWIIGNRKEEPSQEAENDLIHMLKLLHAQGTLKTLFTARRDKAEWDKTVFNDLHAREQTLLKNTIRQSYATNGQRESHIKLFMSNLTTYREQRPVYAWVLKQRHTHRLATILYPVLKFFSPLRMKKLETLTQHEQTYANNNYLFDMSDLNTHLINDLKNDVETIRGPQIKAQVDKELVAVIVRHESTTQKHTLFWGSGLQKRKLSYRFNEMSYDQFKNDKVSAREIRDGKCGKIFRA